jgi:(p)ppGpp synthase/HD superfamily hydrolase
MNDIPDLAHSMVFAEKCHRGHADKAGVMYILHPLRVMRQMDSETEKIVGVLHDIVEDTPITLQDLRQKGYSEEIVEAIDCLTKREGENYEDFIERCKKNPIAMKVKIADLEDNMDIRRLDVLTEKDTERLNRYLRAWRYLTRDEPM